MLFLVRKSKLQFNAEENIFELKITESLKNLNSRISSIEEMNEKNMIELKQFITASLKSESKSLISPSVGLKGSMFNFSEIPKS